MYNRRYKKCCCQKYYDNEMIVSACKNVGTDPVYYTATSDNTEDTDCGCGYDNSLNSMFPENPMYGQSYVPIQTMDKTFTPAVGLKMGTIFPELVNPYKPCQSIEENAFIKAMNEPKEGCNKC